VYPDLGVGGEVQVRLLLVHPVLLGKPPHHADATPARLRLLRTVVLPRPNSLAWFASSSLIRRALRFVSGRQCQATPTKAVLQRANGRGATVGWEVQIDLREHYEIRLDHPVVVTCSVSRRRPRGARR
jgi:hypothetical protein